MESPIWRNQELPLAEYGLEYIPTNPACHIPFPDGTYITQWTDIDRTCDEIAEIVGCPVETVKTRMFYARRRLKALLTDHGEEAA